MYLFPNSSDEKRFQGSTVWLVNVFSNILDLFPNSIASSIKPGLSNAWIRKKMVQSVLLPIHPWLDYLPALTSNVWEWMRCLTVNLMYQKSVPVSPVRHVTSSRSWSWHRALIWTHSLFTRVQTQVKVDLELGGTRGTRAHIHREKQTHIA